MFRLIIVVVLVYISSAIAVVDDSYDDEPFLYMESRPTKYRFPKSLPDKDVFFRVSRAHDDFAPLIDDLDSEFEDFNDEFARPTRSQDKNDNFVRFGRGNSNFVRFGRDPYKHKNQDFIRFGRSIPKSETPKKRSRRDVDESKAKRGDRDNFLRFGRGRDDDSFIRYGRDPDALKMNADESLPVPTKSNFVHGQSAHYPFALNGRLLHNSPLLSILRKLEQEMRQNN